MQSLYNMFHQWLMFAVKSTIDVVVTGDFSSANIEFLKSIKSMNTKYDRNKTHRLPLR